MSVCKFYLNGNCKFGSNCKFDHPSNGYDNRSSNYYQHSSSHTSSSSNYYQNQNSYKYVANNQNSNYRQTNNYSTNNQAAKAPAFDPENMKDEKEFLAFVKNEFQLWLNSSAWKFSCYSYKKSAPSIPILEDISPEEVRWSLYDARRNNTFNQAFQEFQTKYQQTTNTISEMVNPNMDIKNYLVNYFRETLKKPSQVDSSGPNKFKELVQKSQQQQSSFQTSFQSNQSNFFQTTQSQPQFPNAMPTSQNLFQNIVQQNQFKSMEQQATFQNLTQNLFQNSLQNTFQNAPLTQTQSSPFINNNTQVTPTNFFNNLNQQINKNPTAPTFGTLNNISMNTSSNINQNSFNINMNNSINTQSMNVNSNSNTNNSFYSNMNQLSEINLKEFKADKFIIGSIPIEPPPRELI